LLVSIVIPACDAQATIGRAIASLLAQTWTAWEAIVVADDMADYAFVLRGQGIADARVRFASTGAVRTGCHRARNVGMAEVRGDLVGALDADDLFESSRLERLAPLAIEHGAAACNLALIEESSGETLYQPLGTIAAPERVDIARLLALTAPLVPIVRRDHMLPRAEGVEYAEDVIANLQLIDRIGPLVTVPEALYEYRVIPGSIAHDDRSGDAFDAAYAAYIDRVRTGDGFGLSPASRAVAAEGLTAKRALNRRFAQAHAADRKLNFQTFAAGLARGG
jgi:succinoglycan biosynthesis protein ExoO